MVKPIVLKVVTSGDGGVGKTTLVHRYIEGKFLKATRLTIGVEFFLKELTIEGSKVILQIWDFGGQDRFRFLLPNYALGAKGAFFIFDLRRPNTLKRLNHWMGIVRGHVKDIPVLLLGTKSDLLKGKEPKDAKKIEEYQKKYNLFNYVKVSAKTGENLDLAFNLLINEMVKRL